MEPCEPCSCAQAAEALALKQSRVLRIVLGLNASMFVVEGFAGILASSSALVGDSLDMLGDTLAYGTTLFVLRRGFAWKARATLLKALLMAVTAVGAIVAAFGRALAGEIPAPGVMSLVALAALVVNGGCLLLLTRHRSDDMNMASTWTCSRNDLIANGAVIVAAGLVRYFNTWVPDMIVGTGIAALFIASAVAVFRTVIEASGAKEPRGEAST